MTPQRTELPNELADRGIYWQMAGFTLLACASLAILSEFNDSNSRAFLYFEIAVTKLYWAFVIPLAGLFDGVRKMFEKMSEYRAKRKQRWLDEGRQEGRQEGQQMAQAEFLRKREELQRRGVTLPEEAVAILFGDDDASR